MGNNSASTPNKSPVYQLYIYSFQVLRSKRTVKWKATPNPPLPLTKAAWKKKEREKRSEETKERTKGNTRNTEEKI